MKKIKLTIQEIVNDFYSLAEQEGYLSGLAEGLEITDNDKKEYHLFMKKMINKYLPDWKNKINKKYWENIQEDEKGIIISTELCENFKNIFYQLV